MIKAGRLAHVINIERATAHVNDAGTQTLTWAAHAVLRAELLEQTAEEYLRNAGDTTVEALVFRTRYLADITDEDRIAFRGGHYDIEKIVTLGRRRALEIHCKRVDP